MGIKSAETLSEEVDCRKEEEVKCYHGRVENSKLQKKLELPTSKGTTRQLKCARPEMASFVFYNFLWGSESKLRPSSWLTFARS